MTRQTIVVTVVIAMLCLWMAASPAAADEPETGDDFLTAFSDMSDTEAFLEYSELELLRSQAVVETQTGEFTDDDRDRMASLLAALQSFEEAHSHAEAGDREAAIEGADEVNDHLSELRDLDGERYAQLGEVALNRFYEVQAAELYDEAQGVSETPERIEMQRTAAHAFGEAGASQRYSTLTVESEELESRFESDLDRLEGDTDDATAFLDGCDETCSELPAAIASGPEAFERYEEAQTAHAKATAAGSTADEHGLTDRQETLAEVESETFDALVTTAGASAAIVFGYAAVFLLLSFLLVGRIARWERDVESARVPEIVAVQEVTDA